MENFQRASEHVAANVKRLRKERGWTLAQLSEQLESWGHRLTVPVLSKIELGDRGIDVDDLAAFVRAFDTDPVFLLTDPAVVAEARVTGLWQRYREAQIRRSEAVRAAERAGDAELEAIRSQLRDAIEGNASAEAALRSLVSDLWADAGQADRDDWTDAFVGMLTEGENDGEH